MSAEGQKRPSKQEVEDGLMYKADNDQFRESMDREDHLFMPRSTEIFIPRIKKELDGYADALNRFDQEKEEYQPPEWKKDAEKAKKIQSEIRQKLAELKELFKLDEAK